jgi:hypothetical protein
LECSPAAPASTHLRSTYYNNVAFQRFRIESAANADIPAILFTACSSSASQAMGFTLDEIKLFLSGLRDNAQFGPRWRKLAQL